MGKIRIGTFNVENLFARYRFKSQVDPERAVRNGWGEVENIVDRLPLEERWTHFFKGNRSCNNPPAYRQLDYVLLSKSLADSTESVPKNVRSGLPLRAERYTGPRIEHVGRDKPKASDHCLLVMEISF